MVLLTTTRVSTRTFTSSSVRPVLVATGGQQQQQSWTAAAALAGGAFLGAGTVAACDAEAPDVNVNKRKTNVCDPQTYPKSKFDTDKFVSTSPTAVQVNRTFTSKQQQEEEPLATPIQATSPTEDRKNMQLEEQKEEILATEGGPLLPEMTPEEFEFEKATKKAKQHSGGLKLFSGNGNLALSLEICRYLGINLGKATVGRFADGEANIVIHENVRGKDCYIIQPTCPPVNDNIMELLLMISTLRRASARRITVVIPYYGYARQDRKMQARVPISAADVARLIESMGVDRVIAVDLHCGQFKVSSVHEFP